jgi:hypothetical protein
MQQESTIVLVHIRSHHDISLWWKNVFGPRNLVILQMGWDLIPHHLVPSQYVSTISISQINPHSQVMHLLTGPAFGYHPEALPGKLRVLPL